MWLAAELAEAQSLAAELGFDSTPGVLDWPVFIARRQQYISNIHASYRKRFDELGITLIAERGEFLGNGRVRAGGQGLTEANVLIAPGGHARRHDLTARKRSVEGKG